MLTFLPCCWQTVRTSGNNVLAQEIARETASEHVIDAIEALPCILTPKKSSFFPVILAVAKVARRKAARNETVNPTPPMSLKTSVSVPAFNIYIKRNDGSTSIHKVTAETTVESLKLNLEDELGIPLVDQRLVYAGKQLDNQSTLNEVIQICSVPYRCIES